MKRANVAIVVYGLSENWLGGVNYYRNLVSVFDGAADDRIRLHVLTNNPGLFADLEVSSRVVIHRHPMLKHRSLPWVLRKGLMVLLKRDWMLVRLLRQLDIDAVVFSHVQGAQAAGIRCLPWIPDFQSQHHPELFQPEVVEIERQRARDWLLECDGLIVSSEAARADAVALFDADPARLHVMRFAPRLDADSFLGDDRRDRVLQRYGIDRPYFFLPNQYWRHKNHEVVVQALRRLRDAGEPVPLVVSTGKKEDLRDPGYFASFEASVRAAGLSDDYRILGVIDRQDMLVLLAHCVAFINPSRFEGWSTGVEEAKAFGKSMMISDIPVHREQASGLSDVDFFGLDDAPRLAQQLKRRAEAAGIGAVPRAHPNPAVFRAFEAQLMALLTHAASPASGDDASATTSSRAGLSGRPGRKLS